MYRQNTYNEAAQYQLVPVARKAVVPGESTAIESSVYWETEPFSQNIINGGMCSLYAFYVPYRLVWSEWVNYLSDPQSAAVLPTTTTEWRLLFEARSGLTISTLGRRAYKLIYNQFFGQDNGVADNWYSDVTLDTDVSVKRLRTTDQLNGKLMIETDVSQPTLVYPVVTSQVTVNLNDLRTALKNAKSTRRSDMTGDKYVDALRRMGVDLDWRVQMAPEFLGQSQGDFMPKDTRASDATNTGRAWSRYQETIRLRTPRKFFAEHGVVMVCAAVRPHVFPLTRRPAADAALLNVSRDSIFVGDNDAGTVVLPDEAVGGSGGGSTYRAPRFTGYLKGQNLVGNTNDTTTGNQPWITRQAFGANDVVYSPGSTTSLQQDQLFSGTIAFMGTTVFSGPTPVKSNIM